jgi:arylsulfatase A-like enzyme
MRNTENPILTLGRRVFVLLGVLAAWLYGSADNLHAQTARRPNILIVLTDDQGYGDFSCHGNPILKTPFLDRWHARSVRFTDFHSAPMCTPSRGQIMTGRDAVRNGATSVTGGRAFLRPGLLTLPQFLRMLGYRTGLFGKWHLGDNYPHRPTDRGFDKAVYHKGWGMTAAPEFLGKYNDGRYFLDGVEKTFQGYMTDFWFDQAMAWMKERKAKDEPFFCYLATNAPHAPHVVPEKYSKPYQGQKAANFFGMIANIDENIGRLEAFLQQNGLDENTIVIFMTDNGGTAGVPVFNAGLRGNKTTFYEGGHRVPCWISWPAGKFGKPRDVVTPAQMQDLFPTLIDLIGAKAPPDAGFDEASLAGLLRGTEKDLPERMMVVQYSRAKLTRYESCVIWKQWRLVHGTELYDVHADRAQKTDLAARHPDVVKKMKAHYDQWWTALEPLSGKFVPTTIGSGVQPLTELTSSDWQDLYTDNAGHVSQAAGGPRGGVWHIDVATAGEYEIVLRRWPRELDLALTAGRNDKKSVALAVASARVAIQGQTVSAPSSGNNAREIVLRVPLQRGVTQMQAWFQNAGGTDLAGAFYADVRLISPKK